MVGTMKSKKNTIRNLTSMIFALVLTLLFFFLFLSVGLLFGVFNNRVILNKISESNYYNRVYQELEERSDEIFLSRELPVSLLDDVITLEKVYVSGRNYIENVLQNKEYKIPLTQIEEALEQSISEYMMEEGIEATPEITSGIKELVALISGEYRRSIEFQFINYISIYRKSVYQIMKWIFPLGIVCSGLFIFLLLRLHPYKHRGVRYLASSVLSSSSLIILGSLLLLISGFYNKIQIAPDYYLFFIQGYLKWSAVIYLYIGGMGILIGIVLMGLVRYMKAGV